MSTVKGGPPSRPCKVIYVHANFFNTTLACSFSCYVLSYRHASPSHFPNLQQRWNAGIAKVHELKENPLVLRHDNAPVYFLLSC